VNSKLTFTIAVPNKNEVEKLIFEYFVITELVCAAGYELDSMD
jgi:hypothetical protein